MRKILIIGASAAGLSAAKTARKNDPDSFIQIFSNESFDPYYRPYLTEYIGNVNVESKKNFFLFPSEWYKENRIQLIKNTKIVKIDTSEKNISDSRNEVYEYDSLIIATGSNPFVPIQGVLEKEFVFSLRTLKDARIIESFSKKITKATVIGGGLLGLEAAWFLSLRGIKVSVIEINQRLLPNQLDTESSEFLRKVIESKGVEIICDSSVDEIVSEKNSRYLLLKDKRKIETDLVVFSIGVRPEISLAKNCGIATDRGIVVNEKMETSEKNIYGCGDCAQFGFGVPLWMPAIKQGVVAGANAVGGEMVYSQEIYPAALNVFDIKLMSIGNVCDKGVSEFFKKDGLSYKRIFFKDGVIKGAVIINDTSVSTKIFSAVKSGESEENVKNLLNM